MGASSVRSKTLEELQAKLVYLSNELMELFNQLDQGLKFLGETWTDNKYDEYVQSFLPTEKVIYELSEKYKEWANVYLPPRIEKAKYHEDFSFDPFSGNSTQVESAFAGNSVGDKAEVFRKASEEMQNEMRRKKFFADVVDPGHDANEREYPHQGILDKMAEDAEKKKNEMNDVYLRFFENQRSK